MVYTANPIAVAKRREKVETLYGRGFSERAVAEKLGTSVGTVSKDLKHIREENAKWYDENSDPKGRRRSQVWGIAKMFRDVLQEQWLLLSKTDDKQLGLKNGILANISLTVSRYSDRIGIIAPSMDQTWLEDQVRRLNETRIELEQKAKIIPLA